MANTISVPYTTPASLDLTSVSGILVDVVPGGLQYLRKAQSGVEEVVTELNDHVPSSGEAAGISPAVYAHFVECTQNIAKIRAIKGAVLKLAEVLQESEAFYQHERETDISLIADAIRSTAHRKDATVLATFEKTLKYNSQIADKAAKTRRKNAALRNNDAETVDPVNSSDPISPDAAMPSPA